MTDPAAAIQDQALQAKISELEMRLAAQEKAEMIGIYITGGILLLKLLWPKKKEKKSG